MRISGGGPAEGFVDLMRTRVSPEGTALTMPTKGADLDEEMATIFVVVIIV